MEDWKRKLNYNFHSSYHAYAFGLLYQHEQNNGNMNNWTQDGVMDLSNYNAAMAQAYYATNTSKTREDLAPANASYHATSGHCQYRGSGVVYFGETQSGRLLVAAQQQADYNDRANEVRRAQSDSASDSEAHTSPDSWRSGSSRDGGLPQADPATWARKDCDDDLNKRGVIYQDVPYLLEEPRPLAVPGNQNINTDCTYENVPMPPQKKRSTKTADNTKGKVRAAFSESQMNILYQRFSVHRYLPPAEMKSLAELTGLTYKQVKTWFQNRRMKLRRHQKDNSWVCEHNKDVDGNFYNNAPSHMQPYLGDAMPHLKEHYNQQMMDAAYRKSAQQNMAFYLAGGPTGYPTWPSSCPQSAVPPRPQVTGWSMPQNVGHYEYNPNAPPFSPATTNNAVDNTSFESQDTEPANSSGSLSTSVIVCYNASQ